MTAADPAALLAAYDAQLRRDAEIPSALTATTCGPLLLATYRRWAGVHHLPHPRRRRPGPRRRSRCGDLVAAALEHYRAQPEVLKVEWKTRGHDHAPGLHEALRGGRVRARGEPSR